MTLPRLMVAPNGARLTKADHPGLPLSVPEIIATALDCRAAGADGLHAHVRDAEGHHVLDAGLYAELLSELSLKAPGFYVQITTEAIGLYSPADQRALVRALRPAAVSIALREILAEDDRSETARFFAFCAEAGIEVQHILYDAGDVTRLAAEIASGAIPGAGLAVLHVLGRYSEGQKSEAADLTAPLEAQKSSGLTPDWAACAFGAAETDCLLAALRLGGKARIGFENNRTNRDGSIASTNAERVGELVTAMRDGGLAL